MTGEQKCQLIYQLWGHKAVLLPVEPGTKQCLRQEWQHTTWQATQEKSFQLQLAKGGIAVLFGPENLAGLDCDTEQRVAEFLELNPYAKETTQTRGARGRTFHFRISGNYPKLLCKLKTIDGQKIGEWRGSDGYTVVSGIHPDTGEPYKILVEKPPIEIEWSQIKWPPSWKLPWNEKTAQARPSEASPDSELSRRILTYLAGCPAAISGNGGHIQTLKIATQLIVGFALGVDGARPFLRTYNQKCEPPWTDKELEHKLAEAAKNQLGREPGAKFHQRQEDAPIYEEVDLEHFVDEDWESVPEFPLDTLPDTFRKPVEEMMRHYRVPALLPATCTLVINSVALGRGVVTKSNVRRTYGNLYAIIGAQSGSGKTPPFDDLMAPLMKLQKESLEEFRTGQKPRTEAELKLLVNEIQGLVKQGKSQKKFSLSEDCRHEKLAKLLQQKAELEDKLQYSSRLWTEDFTSEALGILLANNKEQMAVLTDDGGLVIYNLLGRYTDGDVKDDILLCKAKTVSAVPVDRVGRESVLLHQPCVAMLVLTQPDLLYRLFGNERLLMGGFLARCLAADSRMEIQYETEKSQADPDPGVMAEWNRHIESLIKMFRFAEDPYWIDVDPEVRKLSRQYFNEWAAKARGTLADVSTFAVRWCERAWEISINLHMGTYGINWADHPVKLSKTTFENAIQISDFFAERQLEVLQRPRIEAEKKQRSRLEELLLNNSKKPMTIRALRDRHGIKKEEVFSSVKSHPDIFGIVTFDPPHGGSKSTLVFLRSDPPPMRSKK